MSVHRDEVVLLNWPFSSGTGSKLRPALVVQSDHNNARLSNTIVAIVTTTTHRSGEPTQLLIDVGTPAGQQSGLKFTSSITCENLFTIEQGLVRRTLGTLPASAMQQINDCLKASLGIS